ncbi:dihydrolipoyl dehydrogenase family protein [Nocardioides sp.]|uniref:dihydrolipoyl dehydrogenase family protein n=1 Tax=Nocardioides sp. TaxID=35761 RepID=UPI0037845989
MRPLVIETDVVVLGLGAGGEHAAHRLAEAGVDVVGVERELVGGECPFWGCTPSKLLVHAAQTGQGWARAAERIREANHGWSDHTHAGPLEEAGVRLLRGHGRLLGPGRVEVATDAGDVSVAARRGILLGTGTAPAVPVVEGLAGTPYWTNRDVVRQREAPASLLVLGGGAIGCELAQAAARLGSRVTLVEVSDRLLAAEEPEASEVVAEALAAAGVAVHVGAEVARVTHDGRFTLAVGEERLEADHLLVATGRRSNLSGLGLESVGIDPDADHVPTDERMRAAERLWAVGDITGHGDYTHLALSQAKVAVRDLLGRDGPWADHHAVSRVTFTDPEVGAVGRTEQQARAAGVHVAVGRADVPRSSRGWIAEAAGVVKLVADADRQVLVGGTVVAPYGGEVVGLLALAVHAEVPLATLRGMHFAYPTFHRAVAAALDDLARG